MERTSSFPPGWDEERVQQVIRHYDSLDEDGAVAEDEGAPAAAVRPYEKRRRTRRPKIEAITHTSDARRNIPTAELAPVMDDADREEIRVAYERYYGNGERIPQLIWRGKDEQDWTDLVTPAPPLFVEEKVHPKALIDDLMRLSAESQKEADEYQTEMAALFADFNGLPEGADKTEFYRHDVNWNNRMILGDSLQVMASLATREGLQGKVQCIYLDPPYGIKFNSNFQWSTTSRDVRDGNVNHITREPEQVRAFRDTWRDGIHSYLSYLRDRFTAARDLLTDSGSIFVQIGDENVHRVRAVMDEVFGEGNFVSLIAYAKTTGFSGNYLSSVCDYLLWYSKHIDLMKYRLIYTTKEAGDEGATKYRPVSSYKAVDSKIFEPTRLATSDQLTSQGASVNSPQTFTFRKQPYQPPNGLHWKTTVYGMERLMKAGRITHEGNSLRFIRFMDDFAIYPRTNVWLDIGGVQSRTDPKVYVVQTAAETVTRCILMTTDPGDLVLDPTCGSGTTAYVAEQWGRRWITIDTSRVALALARARIMGARYPYYLLADSREGQVKEAEVTRRVPSDRPTYGDVRQGFVYERVPHIQLRDIANNAEIDVIWETYQEELEPLREELNAALGESWEEWEVPRETDEEWPEEVRELHSRWWERRIARQKEIDASIAANASVEYLYDKPYTESRRVRVAGPFTVESLSPHRSPLVDEDEIRNTGTENGAGAMRETGPGVRYQGPAPQRDFAADMLEQLRLAGVQQERREDRIAFTSVDGWPSRDGYVCAEGRFTEGETERRAGIFIGPEFGTVSRADLTAAAREAAETGFDLLIACAFSYDAHTADMDSLGKVRILKARMNADLHMATDLKATDRGNLFVVFGEPDVRVEETGDGMFRVRVLGVDIYRPSSGSVESSSPDEIACWFVDTDYNEESFFVRHAYFLGANDPYKSLKTTLKTEINREAWESLHSDVSRPFPRPASGRIAVKVINHLGDEVMKVLSVGGRSTDS